MNFIRLSTAVAAMLATVECTGADARSLAEVRSSGVLHVGVYKDFPPFADKGRGIDVDLGRALAQKLGVKVDVRSYDAGENMDDDLRNIVWRGNFLGLGYGPSDVMVHVPVDAMFMQRNPQVKIFAPYYRETMAVIRATELLPKLDTTTDIDSQPLGTEAESIMSMALLSADGGRLRNQVRHFTDLGEAPAELRAHRIAGFFGMRSQVEPMLGQAGNGFVMSVPPSLPGLPQAGWVLGLAVKADQPELEHALLDAIAELERDGSLDQIFKQHGVTRLAPL